MIGWRPRRIDVPAEVAAQLGRGEHVLSSAQADGGGWILGTRTRLYLVDPSGQVESWPWHEVQRADWDKDASTLHVERVQEYGAPIVERSLTIDEPGDLVALLRERVTATVLLTRHVPVNGKRGFRVIGRRSTDRGETSWAFEFDPGIEPEDPAVRASTERALAEARESAGLG